MLLIRVVLLFFFEKYEISNPTFKKLDKPFFLTLKFTNQLFAPINVCLSNPPNQGFWEKCQIVNPAFLKSNG